MEDAEVTLGQNVRRLREAAGLSQAQVADEMARAGVEGFYPQTVLKVEKGTRALKFVEGLALAGVLGVEPASLYRATRRSEALAGLVAGHKLVQRRRDRYFQAMYDLAEAQMKLRQVLGDRHDDAPWDGVVTPEELSATRELAYESPEATFAAGRPILDRVAEMSAGLGDNVRAVEVLPIDEPMPTKEPSRGEHQEA